MEHTLANAQEAKKLLIEEGFNKSDFTEAVQEDVDLGYLIGEPLIIDEDGFAKSALELYNEKLFWDKHGDDYVDYMLEIAYNN